MKELREVAGLFLRLGFTAFGGPAAHIAMMRQEAVVKRAWLSDEEFLDLVGVTNLIPGPNSTELAIHLGYRRAGRWGLVVAGACFIVPAMLIVIILAWAYVRFGALPAMKGLLLGMKPVVVAIVVQALVGLGKSTLKTASAWITAIGVLALSLAFGVGELWLVFLPGLAFALFAYTRKPEPVGMKRVLATSGIVGALIVVSAGLAFFAVRHSPYSLGALFLVFLKVGSVLYGSGYVLLSYLNTDLVVRLGWLTKSQLLDAISVGQFTPGPVFTAATFVGYVLGGVPGAVVATLGIFLPSFILVGASAKWLEILKQSPTTQSFIAGVNASSLGLMGAVVVTLARTALIDIWTVAIGLVSLGVLLKTKVNSVWLVLGGAVLGLLLNRG